MATTKKTRAPVKGMMPRILRIPGDAANPVVRNNSPQSLLAAFENGRTLDIRLENPRVYVTPPANRHRISQFHCHALHRFHDISLRLPFRLERFALTERFHRQYGPRPGSKILCRE